MQSLMKSKISLVLTAMVCVGMAETSSAQSNAVQSVLYVKADAAGAGDGTSWADAYTSLQDALARAEAGDQIWVAAGQYTPGGPNARSATFQLRSGVEIYGGFAGVEVVRRDRDSAENPTVLSGDLRGNDKAGLEPEDLANEPTRSDNSYHVVTGSGADETAVLDGFVITGGHATGSEDRNGGGMINIAEKASNEPVGTGRQRGDPAPAPAPTGPPPANPTLLNCTFRGNSADRNGGAVYNERGMPTFIDCVFSANHANGGNFEEGGGGIYNQGGDLILRGCRFGGNTGTGGAGMYNRSASPTVIDTVFHRNVIIRFSHDNNGGGILNNGSNATIVNCTFTENLGSFGGGIWNGEGGVPTIVNCVFSRNEAGHPNDGAGGGLQNWSSNPTVINCTFSENSAASLAGGLGEGGGSTTTVSNCIFWGNSARNVTNKNTQIGGGSTKVTYSCVQGGRSGAGNMGDDPLFADPENGDYRLMSQAGRWNPLTESWETDEVTSPCIDAGDSSVPIGPETFPNGGFVNLGAYGGTAAASRSYFDAPPCESIVAGDINGDCQVDRTDLEIMALHWQDDPALLR